MLQEKKKKKTNDEAMKSDANQLFDASVCVYHLCGLSLFLPLQAALWVIHIDSLFPPGDSYVWVCPGAH